MEMRELRRLKKGARTSRATPTGSIWTRERWGVADWAGSGEAARRQAHSERQRHRRHRPALPERRGGRAREELPGAQPHSGEAAKIAAEVAGQMGEQPAVH